MDKIEGRVGLAGGATTSNSPDFENPPVVETSVGFHFIPIQGWTILHYGLLWQKLSDRYQRYEFNPPLVEPGAISVDLTKGLANLPVRVSFVDSANTNLVQVQNNFILHNWRKSESIPLYQHYAVTREALRADWKIYRDFLSEHSLKFTEVVRCEASYFNHLVKGDDWQDYSDLPNLFPSWRGTRAGGTLSTPQMIGITAAYSHSHGMLQIASQPALRQDGKEIIQLTVSATGNKLLSQDDDALFGCLDACHEIAISSFAEFTSDELHARWRKIR
jgi:uncharacterized protein (TIGR04255 family)